MTIEAAEMLMGVLALYAMIGVVFALAFVSLGLTRVDPEAKGMPIQARALVFWGAAGLWPVMLVKLIQGPGGKPS